MEDKKQGAVKVEMIPDDDGGPGDSESGPGRASSIVSEIVLSMAVLMVAATILIAILVSLLETGWTEEYISRYTPFVVLPYILIFAVTVMIFGWRLISKQVLNPLRVIIEATERVAQGDLNQQVNVAENREMIQLARTFNRMTRRLATNRWDLERNVAELKELNRELERAQFEVLCSEKLASVGRLAAGVAHEIGNPLASISGYLEILARRDYLSEKDRDMVRRVHDEVDRISETIKELLDYSRPPDQTADFVDMNSVVDSTLTLMKAQKGFEKIDISFEPGRIPALRANRSSVQQLLMNLVLNAVQAMPDGGTLKIKTAPQARNGHEGFNLTVADSGSGIAKENIKKIFDPFFTTKEPGRGTGLGLSICARIVENMGGRISAESAPGRGTTFLVWAPAAEDDSPAVCVKSHPG